MPLLVPPSELLTYFYLSSVQLYFSSSGNVIVNGRQQYQSHRRCQGRISGWPNLLTESDGSPTRTKVGSGLRENNFMRLWAAADLERDSRKTLCHHELRIKGTALRFKKGKSQRSHLLAQDRGSSLPRTIIGIKPRPNGAWFDLASTANRCPVT